MKWKALIISILLFTLVSFKAGNDKTEFAPPLHEDFVYLKDIMPNLRSDLRYYGSNNFMGRQAKGYNSPKCILTKEAAYALKKVQEEFERIGFGLLIYDAYRPQSATNDFILWAQDESDTTMKMQFYPNIDKKDVFTKGYVSVKSGHSRGSTVDLTIVSLKTKMILNMGSEYDLFDEISHVENSTISNNQRSLRLLLKRRMEKHGFKSYEKEWWHFTFENEPFPNTYFDFPVE